MKPTITRATRVGVLIGLWLCASTAAAVECEMLQVARHGDADRTRIYSADAGRASLYFRADMDVNTDGAARSYHPDDPRGRSRALNNMGNAITRLFDASGADITCAPRRGECFTRFIGTFEAARDARYAPTGHPRIATTGIIPWRRDAQLGWQVPCTIADGPYAGFFVSQTSLLVDPSKDVCDQGRYLDSLAFNAIVLPRGVQWKSQGVATDEGDLVVTRDVASGRVAFAITGDRGPATSIGEGTIALAAQLSARTLDGSETYQQIRALAAADVQYVIFPKDDIRRAVGRPFTQTDIDELGGRVFAEWGGTDRLDACADLER